MFIFWLCFQATAQNPFGQPQPLMIPMCAPGKSFYPCLHGSVVINDRTRDPTNPEPEVRVIDPKPIRLCPEGEVWRLALNEPDAQGARTMSYRCVKDMPEPEPDPDPMPVPDPEPRSRSSDRDEIPVTIGNANEPKPPVPLPKVDESSSCSGSYALRAFGIGLVFVSAWFIRGWWDRRRRSQE